MRLAASDNGDLRDCLEVQHTINSRQTSIGGLLAFVERSWLRSKATLLCVFAGAVYGVIRPLVGYCAIAQRRGGGGGGLSSD